MKIPLMMVGRVKVTGEAVGLMERKDKMWPKSLRDRIQGLPHNHKEVGVTVARTKLEQGREQERENKLEHYLI
jgi:hypothetical protein